MGIFICHANSLGKVQNHDMVCFSPDEIDLRSIAPSLTLMANQVRISTADSENHYVISNIHTASGVMTSNTGGLQRQANPTIVLNDENGLQQPIVNSAEQYPSYMTIANGQSQNSQTSRMSSGSGRQRYTSLQRGHTYESIGNPPIDAAKMKHQGGLGRCTKVTIVSTLVLILVVTLATLAITTFTMWYLINELKDIKGSLGKLEANNCTVKLDMEPGQLPPTQAIINFPLKYIMDAIYSRLHHPMYV